MTTSPIIVGLDPESLAAPSVLQNAIAIARKLDRPLLTVTSAELPADALGAYDVLLEDAWRTDIEAQLKKMLKDAPTGTERVISTTASWRAISDLAKERESPLVVIGSHNRKTLDLVLGSTAQRVAERAPCSVYICRPWQSVQPSFKRMVVAVDNTSNVRTIIDAALKLGRDPAAKMLILHAVSSARAITPFFLKKTVRNLEHLVVEDAKHWLKDIVNEYRDEVDCSTQVSIGSASELICDASEKEDCDMVAIGAHSGSVADILLGSTTARVLHNVRRSLLIVKGQGL